MPEAGGGTYYSSKLLEGQIFGAMGCLVARLHRTVFLSFANFASW